MCLVGWNEEGIHTAADSAFQPSADEEIGGHDGMEKFVKTDAFKELNIGEAEAAYASVYILSSPPQAWRWMRDWPARTTSSPSFTASGYHGVSV